MRTITRSIAITLAGLLAAAAPAGAAGPIDLGPGSYASVVVDAAGTAHIAFQGDGGQVYCRLPRNAAACDVRTFLPLEGSVLLSGPHIFDRADGALVMVVGVDELADGAATAGMTYVRTSADRGASWSPPVLTATGARSIGAAALAPGGRSIYTLTNDTNALLMQNAPLVGSESRTLNIAGDPEDSPDASSLAVMPDGRAVIAEDDVGKVHWRVLDGADPYDPNAYTAPAAINGVWDAKVVTGPRGTYLFEHRPLAAQRTAGFAAPFALRSLDTKSLRWRSPKTAGADRSIFGSSDALQDASGRLHIVAGARGAGATSCVLYTRAGPKRRDWFGKTTVLFKTTHEPQRVKVAAAPDGRGVVTWEDGDVWVMPLRQAKGRYRPRRNQNDRPACVGKRY